MQCPLRSPHTRLRSLQIRLSGTPSISDALRQPFCDAPAKAVKYCLKTINLLGIQSLKTTRLVFVNPAYEQEGHNRDGDQDHA
jgi:hypothetical protein